VNSRDDDDDDLQVDLQVNAPTPTQSSWPGALTMLGFFGLIGFIVWVCCSSGGRFGAG
jgi:hypothetical protein